MSDSDLPREEPRQLLARLLAEKGAQITIVSREIGMNHAYLSQYLARRRPRFLSDKTRQALGRYFGVDPERFRAPDEPTEALARQGLDPDLVEKATYIAQRVIGDDPQDNWLRAQVTATAYSLLEPGKPIRLDDEGTLAVLALLAQRVIQRVRARGTDRG